VAGTTNRDKVNGSWVDDELAEKDERILRATTALRLYEERRTAIRTNQRLTEDEKRRLIAAEWVRAADVLKAAREDYFGESARELEALRKKRLGAPSAPFGANPEEALVRRSSYRDALERADRRENADELERLLRQAVLSGDKEQEQAVLVTAMERAIAGIAGSDDTEAGNPLDVVNTYVEAHPEAEADLQRIINLSATVGQTTSALLQAAFSFAPPMIPAETGAVNEADVRLLAASAPTQRESFQFGVS
jgi:hypothetical protein